MVGCVVIPVYDGFLQVLVHRRDTFTTLIWPGQHSKAERMAGPSEWFKATGDGRPAQEAIPFLFRSIGRSTDPPYEVSHAGLAVYMAHDDICSPDTDVRKALSAKRVERFSGDQWGDEGVRTWYVVTETHQLKQPISYETLRLVQQERALAANFTRGYAMVHLPASIQGWFARHLVKVAERTDLLALPYSDRWRLLR